MRRALRFVAIVAALASATGADSPIDRIRVEAEASPRRVYAGQRVTLTYRLVTPAPRSEPAALQPSDVPIPPAPQAPAPTEAPMDDTALVIRDIRLVREPRFPNFWANEIQIDADASDPERTVFPLRQLRLFPLTAGRLQVDAAAFRMLVYPNTLETLDDGPQRIVREVDPLTVEVLPLPERGKPATFGGAVGRVSLSASCADDDARVGEALRIRIDVRGDGNLETTSPPFAPPLDGARAITPRRISVDLGLANATDPSHAVWVVDVVPERTGRLAIGPFAMDYFDPQTKRYETSRTDALSVVVLDREHVARPTLASVEAKSWPWWFWVAALALAALVPAAVVAVRARRRVQPSPNSDAAANAPEPRDPATMSQLRSRLKRAIVRAEEARRADDGRAVYACVLAGFTDLLTTLYDVQPGSLTRETLVEGLGARAVHRPLVDRAVALYDRCQEAGFSPSAVDADRAPIEEAIRLFEDLARASDA